MQAFEVHLIHEQLCDIDPEDDNEDVIVTLADGRRYSATVFTVKNVITLMERRKQSGEQAHGPYFHCPDGFIVERLTRDVITRAVADMLATGSFFSTLTLLEND